MILCLQFLNVDRDLLDIPKTHDMTYEYCGSLVVVSVQYCHLRNSMCYWKCWTKTLHLSLMKNMWSHVLGKKKPCTSVSNFWFTHQTDTLSQYVCSWRRCARRVHIGVTNWPICAFFIQTQIICVGFSPLFIYTLANSDVYLSNMQVILLEFMWAWCMVWKGSVVAATG